MNKCGMLLLGAISWFAFTAAAQDTNILRTQIGQFENRTGSVIVKGFAYVSSVSPSGAEISVRLKETTDVSIGRKLYGLSMQIEVSGTGAERIYIDEDEIEPLLTGLNYLIKINNDITSLPGFEATYKTKGGLQLFAHSIRRDGGVRYSIQGNDTPTVALTALQITQLYEVFVQAQKNLEALKAGK